jgi:inhibitor of KinA sporulation pathway (predicted exonuclease)
MAKLLDQIIIVDLEATCWEDGNFNRRDGQESEIIEIGLCLVDLAQRRVTKAESIIVKPEKSSVSPFCTQLTTLTPEMVSKGVTLAQACATIARDYKAEQRTWGSWGDYDRVQFDRDCSSKHVRMPFGRTHLNIKNLFSLMKGLPKEYGVGQALEKLHLSFEGTPHRGVDDARNIARLFVELLPQRKG